MEFVVEKVMGLSWILRLFQTSHVFSNVTYSFIIIPEIGQINLHLTVLQPWSSDEALHLTGPLVGLR
jgi:hypothetical protein